MYDTADISKQNKPSNRARLPIPDEVHAGVYAMVTSRSVDTGSQNEPINDPLDDSTANRGAVSTIDPTERDTDIFPSASRNSLFEREGLVITSLDKKFGIHDTEEEESFVSSANIEHTVVSEGSVYAIVQTRPKSRKSKSSASSDDTGKQPADQNSNPDEPPKKPPRTPPTGRKPPSYQPKSEDSTPPRTPDSPNKVPLNVDRPASAGSGPPSFPPPPPPMSKSPTPEPVPMNDPTYAVVALVSKPKSSVKKDKVSVPALKQPEPKLSQDEISTENGYSLVSKEFMDGQDDEPPPEDLVHIDDVLATDSVRDQRPPHLYSTIQKSESLDSPTVSVRMVSHGYATVTDKKRTSGGKKKTGRMSAIPRLPPRAKPPPPPPNAAKRDTNTHKPLGLMVSSPVGPQALSPAEPDSVNRALNTRSTTFSQAEPIGEPKFLFSQKMCQSLIPVSYIVH